MQVPMLPIRFLRRTAQLYAAKTAVICGDECFTYAQFQDRINQLSHALRRLGVGQGDRVAYLALNCHRLVEGYYGVPQIGAILLCLNIRLNPQEIAFILNDAQPKVLILSQSLASVWEAIQGQCPSVEHVIIMEGRLADHDWPGYDEVIAAEPVTTPPLPEIDENDVAELFYTSGTTAGRPKGVMLTYRNLYTHTLSTIIAAQLTDTVVQLVGTVPLFHVNAWGAPHYLVAVGATQVVVPRFDPQLFCEVVQRHRVTHVLMVSTMLNALLNYPDLDRYDLSSLQKVNLGGAPAPYTLIEQGRRRLKCECLMGYGLTETSPVICLATIKSTLLDRPQEEKDRRQAMTGLPVITVDIEIFDDQGRPVPHDGKSIGEIWVRGDVVMKGYWNRPEETAAVFRNGWFLTGDMATIDPEGYINIVDRKKDIIISGGENISTVAVEDVIYRHPAVQEAAVIGVPDPRWGETVKAMVVRKPGQSLTEEELIQFCRQYLGGFEVPRSVDFVDELPKTATGKIVKQELRERYWRGHESRVI
jgi:fatty-acyl-CoA synthase